MTDLRALAFVHWGRWIAWCPVPGCTNAEHFGADPTTGHVGGLTGSAFRCAHCHWLGPAVWPPNVDDIMWLLRQRPVPATRNWLPTETIHDLFQQNLEQGILPISRDQIESGDTAKVLELVGDRVASGALEGGYRRGAIGAAITTSDLR